MQFEILILILPLFTSLVQTRRVIRAAPGKKTTGHYLVVVPPETSHERFEAIAEKIQNESLSSEMHKMEGPFVKIIVTKLSLDEANKIKDLDNVEFVEEETFAEASLSWALDRIDQVSPVLDGMFEPGGDGEGVDIYILDTGINYDHCEFDGYRAIYAGYDPVDNNDGTNLRGRDCHGHGTHVASLACGKNYGVAKKADCYSVRVLGCTGRAPYSVVIDGLNFAASNIINSCRPGIISMSLGGPFFSSLNFVSSNIVNRGIPVVASAGNEFTDACTRSPASAPGVITVGSSARGDDVSFFTNIGSCVNIFAPGSDVIGADHRCDDCTCTKSLSGTSMAAPLVSGTIALYLQEQPLLTPPQILEKLTEDCLKNVLNFNGLPFSLRDKTPNCLLHITGLGLDSGLFTGSRCASGSGSGSGSASGSGFDSGSGSGDEPLSLSPSLTSSEEPSSSPSLSSIETSLSPSLTSSEEPSSSPSLSSIETSLSPSLTSSEEPSSSPSLSLIETSLSPSLTSSEEPSSSPSLSSIETSISPSLTSTEQLPKSSSLSSSEELSTLPTLTISPTPSPSPDICTCVLPYINLTSPTCLKSKKFSSRRINPKRGIKIGVRTHTSLFVNYNGIISLSKRFLFSQPFLFPSNNRKIKSSYVFAPMWNFYDIKSLGKVCYQVFDDDNIADQPTLDEVNHFIQKKNNASFNGMWMIVVEWRGIHAYPHSFATRYPYFYTDYTWTLLKKTNTFQAIIITDHVSSTYVIYTYKCGDLKWDTFYYTSTIGYNVPGFGFDNHPLSGRKNEISGTLDCLNRNCSFTNIVYYFSNDKDASQRCLEAKYKDVLLHGSSLPLYLSRFSFAQRCPCQLEILLHFDYRWFFIGYEGRNIECYANYRFGISGVCCYNKIFGFRVSEGPSASRVALYNPFIFPTLYAKFDEKFRRVCCLDSTLCDVFHSRRPRLFCYNSCPYFFGWNFGDPHITTLDGRSYTFNGLGEYVMTRITGHFELQARTALATNSTGTIFSAVAMGGHGRDSELKERVQVEIGMNNDLVILVNGSDISSILTAVNSFIRYDTVFLKRLADDTVRVVFSNDVAINVTLRVGLLSFVVLVPQNLLSNAVVNGLLGNIDGNSTNEFIYRNGTVLSDDTTDRILHTFGQSWQVTEDESLFYYSKGQGVANYSVPDHIPHFLDEIDDVRRKEAENVCGGPQNIQCIFDYCETGNRELAQNTQRTMEENEENQEMANNTAPLIEAAEHFIVTINETSIFILNITDPGDSLNVTVEGNLPAEYTFENLGSIYFLGVMIKSVIKDLSIIVMAKDSMGAVSAIQPQVRICGCQNGGNCTAEGVMNTSSNPLLLLCDCNEAYDGDFCENDADGCSEMSCFNGSKCDDNKAPAIGGTCPACPSGYTGDGSACVDIDECANVSLCSQRCVNSIGSYECQCNSGYELSDDKHSCNDIDECSRFLYDCQQICVNTLGSYNCSCHNGFILQNDAQSCVVDPKRKCPDNNKCEQLCALDVRSSLEVCYCYSGYVLDSNGLNCTDINECNIATNPCEQHCINNDGSFICKCNNSYTLNADGFTCTDIDECFEAFMNEESICPGNQICQNMPGKFKCSCPEGSRLQRTMCVADDIGSSSMLSSSMNTVITTSILSSTSLPTSTDNGFLEGTIAGIVLGSFVGILLIALLLFILVFILYKHFTKTEKYSFAKGSGVKADDYTIQNIYYEAYTSNQEDQSEMHPHLKEHVEEREESQI